MSVNWVIYVCIIYSSCGYIFFCWHVILPCHDVDTMLLFAAQEIVDALNSNKNVSILEFKGNTLGVNAAKAIGTALEQHPDIKVCVSVCEKYETIIGKLLMFEISQDGNCNLPES